MLRVGLTGGLGSGKSTAAQRFAALGARVFSADATLARIAFTDGRLEELNAIVHPAVIARQAELIDEIAARDADAVAIVESALIFETKYGGGGGCRRRFDRLIFVKAPEELKIARFVARAAGSKTLSDEERRAFEAEARRRIARQIDDESKAAKCDYVLTNDGSVEQLHAQVDALWPVLKDAAKQRV
ncbi:MAG: dephospho-CoA kinase [Acidobacteriaceae bacterium]